MKRLNLLKLAGLGALLLFSTSCGGDEPKEKPNPDPVGGGEVVATKATAIAISPMELTLKVGEKKQMEVVFTPKNATDKAELEWDVRHPNIAVIDDEGVVSARGVGETEIIARLGDLKQVCKLKVEKKVYPKLDVEVEQTYITPIQANFKITPKDPNLEYFCDLTTKKIYYSKRTKDLGGIIESDKGYWKFSGGDKSTFADWKKTWSCKGVLEFSSRKFKTDDGVRVGAGVPVLDWGTDYIFYMYTLDADGNQSSEIYTKEFKTPDLMMREDLTFDINIERTTAKSFDATITPSDPNALYIYHIDKKRFWDNRQDEGIYNRDLGAEGSLMWEVLRDAFLKNQVDRFRKGTLVFKSEDDGNLKDNEIYIEEFKGSDNVKERVLFVFGVDLNTGAITGITHKLFTLKD